jgi:hypothetical protein
MEAAVVVSLEVLEALEALEVEVQVMVQVLERMVQRI